MSIAIVVFGLGCWLHYSPVNRSLASRLHVARIPRIDSLTSSIVPEWFQIEFEFDSDGNSQPLYVYIDRVKRQRFFCQPQFNKKNRIHIVPLIQDLDFFGKFLPMFQCTRKRKLFNEGLSMTWVKKSFIEHLNFSFSLLSKSKFIEFCISKK